MRSHFIGVSLLAFAVGSACSKPAAVQPSTTLADMRSVPNGPWGTFWIGAPEHLASNVSTGASLSFEVDFDASVKRSDVEAGVRLFAAGQKAVVGDYAWTEVPEIPERKLAILRFTPSVVLTAATDYSTAVAPSGTFKPLKNLTGIRQLGSVPDNAVEPDAKGVYRSSFRTGSRPRVGRVILLSPDAGKRLRSVTIAFTEEMDRASLEKGISINAGGVAIDGSVMVGATSERSFSFVPRRLEPLAQPLVVHVDGVVVGASGAALDPKSFDSKTETKGNFEVELDFKNLAQCPGYVANVPNECRYWMPTVTIP